MSRRIGRKSCFESLETRAYMTASTVVGDATFVLYDGHETATLDTGFVRPVATVDAQGNPVAADEQRYGETATYAPPVQWQDTGVSQPQANLTKILASGWDFDGETPLMVYQDQIRNRLIFYRGDNLTVVPDKLMYRNDVMNGTVAGEIYVPKAAIIHHGLIVVGTTRWKLMDDGAWKAIGVEFFTTQDYGASFQRVPAVGGELPVLEPAIGDDRLQTWSFQNPFPVNGIDDTNAVWFPWTDYIYKPGFPKGGQVGLFRADRAPGETHWTLSPNRVIYSQWVDEDSGGIHAHTAAVTIGGIISHWGDVSYRNHTLFHKFDLDNYQTAPVVTTFAYGGYTPTVGKEQGAPQPVAAAPSPVFGEHIAGGDETPDHILSFGPMTNSTDRLKVTSEVYKPEGIAPGGTYQGAATLHLQWLQGIGYTATAAEDDYYYFSRDGKHWARLTLPTSTASTIWLYGDRLLTVVGGRFYVAELPSIEVVEPLSISPGGINQIDTTLAVRTAPGAGNTARRVVYQGDAWRYADTLVAMTVQAPPPPFLSDAPVYEITMGDQDANLGSWWLQPSGTTSSTNVPHLSDVWVANLASQELKIGANHVVDNAAGQIRFFQINDNTQWTATGVSLDFAAGVQGRYAISLRTVYGNPGASFLVAIPYSGESSAATYPIPTRSTAPDELQTTLLGPIGESWTAGFVARWPENARPHSNIATPIASLTGPTGDAVVWSIYQRESGTRLSVEVFKNGALTSRQDFNTKLLRGDIFETLVSLSGGQLRITFRTDGEQSTTFELSGVANLQLDKFQWAGRDGDVVMGIDPILLVADKGRGWTTAEHKQWAAGSLAQKAVYNSLPAPGDFNSDGVVDMADLDVWEAMFEAPVSGLAADANDDGYIDDADYAIWRQQYGSVGIGLAADFNGDGRVDSADYTVWRDTKPAFSIVPGSGADANADGHVDNADLVIWAQNYGKTYRSLEELRSGGQTPTLVSETAPLVASQPVSAEDDNDSSPLSYAMLITPTSNTTVSSLVVMKAPYQISGPSSQSRATLLMLDAALASGADELPASLETSRLELNEQPGHADEAFAERRGLGSFADTMTS